MVLPNPGLTSQLQEPTKKGLCSSSIQGSWRLRSKNTSDHGLGPGPLGSSLICHAPLLRSGSGPCKHCWAPLTWPSQDHLALCPLVLLPLQRFPTTSPLPPHCLPQPLQPPRPRRSPHLHPPRRLAGARDRRDRPSPPPLPVAAGIPVAPGTQLTADRQWYFPSAWVSGAGLIQRCFSISLTPHCPLLIAAMLMSCLAWKWFLHLGGAGQLRFNWGRGRGREAHLSEFS